MKMDNGANTYTLYAERIKERNNKILAVIILLLIFSVVNYFINDNEITNYRNDVFFTVGYLSVFGLLNCIFEYGLCGNIIERDLSNDRRRLLINSHYERITLDALCRQLEVVGFIAILLIIFSVVILVGHYLAPYIYL